jgi:diguanylate cyclase (GGDEF)-like protein
VLLMADVDRFKVINDGHGHAAGDAALRRIAGALVAGLRPGDLLARFGGEEFVALLGNTSEQNAMKIAERLRRLVSAPTADAPVCTISIGVAAICAGETFEALVTRADEALFRAKEAGRNRVSR